MRTKIQKFVRLSARMLAGLLLVTQTGAQTLTVLHQFTALDPDTNTNVDGANAYSGMVLSGNILYGTANAGGDAGNGVIFAVNVDGGAFTNLHSFTALDQDSFTNDDGAYPYGRLIASNGKLYGTTHDGGDFGYGVVFSMNIDGTDFTNLHSFNNDDGANPYGGLILDEHGSLYGTTYAGGGSGNGTVFVINTNGTAFEDLYSFTSGDGANPYGGLALSEGTLYGTTLQGGSDGEGTIFSVTTDGSNFTNVHSFNYDDGAYPYGSPIVSSGTLYGTANLGGQFGFGTIFSIGIDGSNFTNVYSFSSPDPDTSTNRDGAFPYCRLVLDGNTLYGVAYQGGNLNKGTIFSVNTDGSGFNTLHSLMDADGIEPYAGLILSDGVLYGTTFAGGDSGNGTIFSLTLSSVPELGIVLSGGNAIITWPSSITGYTLQTNADLTAPGNWNNISIAPVVIGNLNVVTNSITGSQMFYRLMQ